MQGNNVIRDTGTPRCDSTPSRLKPSLYTLGHCSCFQLQTGKWQAHLCAQGLAARQGRTATGLQHILLHRQPALLWPPSGQLASVSASP